MPKILRELSRKGASSRPGSNTEAERSSVATQKRTSGVGLFLSVSSSALAPPGRTSFDRSQYLPSCVEELTEPIELNERAWEQHHEGCSLARLNLKRPSLAREQHHEGCSLARLIQRRSPFAREQHHEGCSLAILSLCSLPALPASPEIGSGLGVSAQGVAGSGCLA